MTTNNELGTRMLVTAESGDAAAFLVALGDFKDALQTPGSGSEYVNWLSNPANLTKLHLAISTNLNVPPRLLAIKRLSVSRGQKCMMMLRAMEISVRKIHNL